MLLLYDAPTDTASLDLGETAVRCRFDDHGRLLSIEIPHASRVLPQEILPDVPPARRVNLAAVRRDVCAITNTSSEVLHEVVVRYPGAQDEQGRTFEAAWEGIPPGATQEFPAPRVGGSTAASPPHAEVAYLLQPRWEHHLEKIP